MLIILLIAATIFCSSFQSPISIQAKGQTEDTKSIILSNYDSAFGLQTKIEAKITEKADSVDITMVNIKRQLRENCPDKVPRRLVAMSVGLARRTQDV